MRRNGVIGLCSGCALTVVALSAGAHGQAPEPQSIDRQGANVDALRRVAVWEAPRGGHAALVRRTDGQARAIRGARGGAWTDDPLSPGNFADLDLGIDARGRVVATYRLCGSTRCRGPFLVDVRAGGPHRLQMRTPPGCRATGSAAVWRASIATTLSCAAGARRSGIYVLRRRRSYLVRTLTDSSAKAGTEVDLVGDAVAGVTRHRVWVASASARCRAIVAKLPSFANLERVALTQGRVWWGVSTAADFGGSDFEYGMAVIGPRCSVGKPQRITTFPELDWASGTFAVDGRTVYVAGRETGGVVSAPAN